MSNVEIDKFIRLIEEYCETFLFSPFDGTFDYNTMKEYIDYHDEQNPRYVFSIENIPDKSILTNDYFKLFKFDEKVLKRGMIINSMPLPGESFTDKMLYYTKYKLTYFSDEYYLNIYGFWNKMCKWINESDENLKIVNERLKIHNYNKYIKDGYLIYGDQSVKLSGVCKFHYFICFENEQRNYYEFRCEIKPETDIPDIDKIIELSKYDNDILEKSFRDAKHKIELLNKIRFNLFKN